MDDFWMIGLILFLLFAGFGTYILLMIFFPEWVGITGKEALRTMNEHSEGAVVDDRDIYSSEGLKKPKSVPKGG
jgi:hypothetical protein